MATLQLSQLHNSQKRTIERDEPKLSLSFFFTIGRSQSHHGLVLAKDCLVDLVAVQFSPVLECGPCDWCLTLVVFHLFHLFHTPFPKVKPSLDIVHSRYRYVVCATTDCILNVS